MRTSFAIVSLSGNISGILGFVVCTNWYPWTYRTILYASENVYYILRRVLSRFELWQVLLSLPCPVLGLNAWYTKFHVWKILILGLGTWMSLVWILVFSSMSLGQFKLFLEEMITSLCHYEDEMKAVTGHALCPADTSSISSWTPGPFIYLVVIYWMLPLLHIPARNTKCSKSKQDVSIIMHLWRDRKILTQHPSIHLSNIYCGCVLQPWSFVRKPLDRQYVGNSCAFSKD